MSVASSISISEAQKSFLEVGVGNFHLFFRSNFYLVFCRRFFVHFGHWFRVRSPTWLSIGVWVLCGVRSGFTASSAGSSFTSANVSDRPP